MIIKSPVVIEFETSDLEVRVPPKAKAGMSKVARARTRRSAEPAGIEIGPKILFVPNDYSALVELNRCIRNLVPHLRATTDCDLE